MDTFNRYKIASQVDKTFKYIEWAQEIPAFEIPQGYKIKVIPPFRGALVRFLVIDSLTEKEISIYLDGYNLLGYYNGAYWELYPNMAEDVSRYPINSIDKVIAEAVECLKFKAEKEDLCI